MPKKCYNYRKLSKAVKWGDQLARLCDHAADDKTKLEAHVRSDTVFESFYRN